MSNFTPLRITTIKPEKEISFSLFIFFKEQYLEYLKPGTSIEKDKYKKLRRQKITKFFILDSDEKKYQQFLDNLLEETLNSDDVSVEDKTEMVEGQAQTAMERMQDDPGSEDSFDMTRKAAQNLRQLIFDNPEALAGIFGSKSESDPVVKHSLNVCALSVKLAKKMKCSDEEVDYLSTAALMHDIGITQLEESEQALFNKPKNDFEPNEKLTFNKHCKEFIKVLSDRPYINGKIISLIENHEENRAGTGPYKKKKLELTEEILSMVNTYDKKIITQGITPAEAIKAMMIDDLGNYDLKFLQKFQELLKEEKLV